MSGALVFAVATQERPLDHLAPEARGTCIPGSYGTVTIGGTVVDRLPLPGLYTYSRLTHTSSLSEKGDFYLIQELWPEGQEALCLALWRGFQEVQAGEHSLCALFASPRLASVLQK